MRTPLLAVLLLAAPALAAPRPLTLREAAGVAAEHNLGVLADRTARELAALLAGAAWRPYVPLLEADLGYDDGAASLLGADARERLFDYGAGVRWHSPIGTDVFAGVAAIHTLSSSFDPAHSARLVLALEQNILRDGWNHGPISELRELELESEVQRERFRAQLNGFLVEVSDAYWELAFAQADIETTTRSRDRARGQRDDTAQNIARGILADIEIHVVEENLVFFEQQLLVARQNLVLAQSRLARLLNLDPGAELLASELPVAPPELPSAERVLERARVANPELLAARLTLEQAELRAGRARNLSLPRLDLQAQVSLAGAATEAERAYATTVERPGFGAGLAFEVPLDGDPDDAREAGAAAEVRRRTFEHDDAGIGLGFEVRDALTRLASQRERLLLDARLVQLAELKLQAEHSKYQNGISTLNDVVRFQRDLDQAIIARQRAEVGLVREHTRLLALQGDLHETLGVDVR